MALDAWADDDDDESDESQGVGEREPNLDNLAQLIKANVQRAESKGKGQFQEEDGVLTASPHDCARLFTIMAGMRSEDEWESLFNLE